ncbi:MAG: cytochrome c3 family protein [Myxococcota bacterium]
MVSPARLSSERSAEVCGRCHGQRKTDQLDAFLATGDPFVPGDDLARYSEPLWHDTTLAGEAPFEARFWADGTPRLTAYEYQGWLQSPCRADERWTCESCHAMHEGDPAGQLRPDLEGDRVCTQCHVVETPHAAHQTVDAQCVDCHMPRIVYGLIGAHRSHRVEVPSETTSRPNACALCHVDDGPLRDVFAGDPIERAIAADALGESAFGDDDQVRGVLLDVMEFDPYPAVRRIAFRALRKRATLGWEAFRPATPRAERQAQVEALRARVSHRPPNAAEVASLRALASAQAIEIGE